MSLYANLLDDGSASIARDPVLFKNEQDHAPAKKAIDPGMLSDYLLFPLFSRDT